MDKIDITQFTDEKNNIQPKKLGDYIIKQEHIAHIKPTKDSTTTDALSTPLYSYNTKYGVYSELTHTSTAPLRNMIYRYTGDLEVPTGRINDTIQYINSTAPVLPFIENNIIAFQNVLYDVEHDRTVKKTPSTITTTRMTNTKYNPNQTDSKELDTFMNNLFSGYDDDAEMMNFIYECIGYCLVNNTFAQKFFILYGKGGNGKSAFLKLIERLLTSRNVSSIALIDFDGNRFKLADIVGKYANIGDDINHKTILETANLKKVVTGDKLMVERKGQNPYVCTPHAKLFFSTNSLPNILDTSNGMTDRLIIIPMTNRIRGTLQADSKIIDMIEQNGGLTVLLNRAITGLKRLRSQGKFTIPPRVIELTRQYVKDNNNVSLFLEDIQAGDVEYDNEPLASISNIKSKELYPLYSQWATNSGYRALNKKAFENELKELGCIIKTQRLHGTPQKLWVFTHSQDIM